MQKTAMTVASGCLAVVMACSAAPAGETADLQKQLDELKAKVEKLEAKKDSSSGEKKSSWTDKVTLFGDFRYRHEDIEQPGRDTDLPDQNRDRIRVRLGLKAKVNDEVDLTFRIATGSATDPVSTNQTLEQFTKKTILLDLAYFDYHPQALKDAEIPLNVLGGKMEVPFIKAGGSDLIWDGDLTPEGMAIKVAPKFGDMAELTFTLGGFWVDERNTSTQTDNNEDAGLFGAQLALKLNFEEKGKVYAMAGVGQFDYLNVEGKTISGVGATAGNTANGTLYQNDYNQVEFFAEVGFPVLDVPVALYVDYVKNTAADKNTEGDKENTGYMLGFNVGKLKDQWDWSLGYNYRKLERDCVLGAFTDSDSGGGGTNVKGNKYSAQLMVLKNVTAGVTFFDDKVNISKVDTVDKNADYRRLQLDVGFKF